MEIIDFCDVICYKIEINNWVNVNIYIIYIFICMNKGYCLYYNFMV